MPGWRHDGDRAEYELGLNLLAYLRSSTDEQSRSCRQQMANIAAEWVQENLLRAGKILPHAHAPAAGIYADDGVSGWKYAPEERPGSSALLAFCRAHRQPKARPGLIWIWSLSRLGRFHDGPAEAVHCLYEFYKYGWEFYSVEDGSLSCVDRERLLTILKIALSSEKDTKSSEDKSKDVARGKVDAVHLGIWHGGEAPYGYMRWAARLHADGAITWLEPLPPGKRNGFADENVVTLLRPDPATAETAQLILRLAAEGDASGATMSTHAIAADFNQAHTTPPKGADAWYASTIEVILTNNAYRAKQAVGGKARRGVLEPARWTPLIDESTWAAVQERLASSRTRGRGTNSVYVLTGLLHCAHCGARYFGAVDRSRRREVFYYRANTPPGGVGLVSCSVCLARVRADDIEPVVVSAIASMASHPTVRQAVVDEAALGRGGRTARATQIDALRNERATISDEIGRVVKLVGAGGAVGHAVDQELHKLNQRAADIDKGMEALLAKRDTHRPIASHVQLATDFKAVFEAASMEERKRQLARFATRVDVDAATNAVRIHFLRVGGAGL